MMQQAETAAQTRKCRRGKDEVSCWKKNGDDAPPSPERLTPQMRNGLGTAEEEVDK